MGEQDHVCILRQEHWSDMIPLGNTMTQSLMSRDKAEAKKKGLIALSAWAGAGLLFVYHWPIVGLATVAGAVVLTYRWFMFRAKRGMRF